MFNLINNGISWTITMPTWMWAIIGVLFVLGVANMFRRGGVRH